MRLFLFSFLILFLPVVPAGAAGPEPGVKPPTEDGVYLVMKDRSTLKLPRLTGKPCDVLTSELLHEVSKVDGVEKFFYVPVNVLSQIPIVSSDEVQSGYFVSRTEKIENIRNLVFLDNYLDGRKILPGAYKDGCLAREIKDPAGYIALSAWGWAFDKVLRARYVDDSTSSLEILSRLPFEVDRTRPVVKSGDTQIEAFGTFLSTDKYYYPFIPQTKLLGFLYRSLDQPRQPGKGGLDPRTVELATRLEQHLREAGESAQLAAWVAVASVYREAGLIPKAKAIFSGMIEPRVRASGDGKLAKELGERYQKLAQAFGTGR
ncbi:MAG: hypothetical protein QOF89_1079 [Acidobacteriota bacterium]|nr:hypothetical protein [Acidobacteriota bacterium]